MEKEMHISGEDGIEIAGLLSSEESKNLIIFVHGLSGSMTEAHYFVAKEFFVRKGFGVFRFNLYASGEKNRKLETSTIQDHSKDIFAVLSFFSGKYENLYLIGHSLGGPSIIGVQRFPSTLKHIVFWDPAFDTKGTVLKCFEKNEILFYIGNGKNIEISSQMHSEFVENKHLETLKTLDFDFKNVHVIYASEARHKEFYQNLINLGIEYQIITGANHGFTQEGKYEELFEKTLYFLKK